MLTINRRKIMLTAVAGASGTLLGTAVPGTGLAQPTAPASVGNVGHYRFKVGDITATVLSDGLIGGPPKVYAGDAPEAELHDALRQAFLPTDFMTLNLNTLLLEIDGRRVLLEAGAGSTMGPKGGRLFDNLSAIGLSADDIDLIVISHTHPDHVGNLRTGDGGRAFPRATVMVPKADWAFFVENEPDLSYMPVPEAFQKRFAANIKQSLQPVTQGIAFYEAGAELLPGLTTIAASGHTPGMATFLVHSGGDQLLLTADLAYHPVVNIDRPWRPGPDRDQEAAATARGRIFDQAAADRMLVLGFHYPFPGLGRILRTDSGYAWVPAGWQF
ncbi:glyoxylase-like metal-dependent hydrolase (beta-lactamase superfamily II) [Ancylobacter aquaticus]|uniref:Glyoxylase-like metal-dependent hydrolase (Beta-lactamase superfamily II) n=2 Tax=Ancylobacter aquaticus TaxID=100 RepID=A0A4R1IHA2_ANCAQ|nr:glyoxylase-like metal-dependent hydrolase (beta-lactamase superfamily II) [Ancylobacter aquaticus]